jgi:hypothetical protein
MIRSDLKNVYRIIGIKTAGTSLSMVTSMFLKPGYIATHLLVSNNYLIVAGNYYMTDQRSFVIKVPLNPLNGAIMQSNALLFWKRGTIVDCREKNNRAIIVSQQ